LSHFCHKSEWLFGVRGGFGSGAAAETEAELGVAVDDGQGEEVAAQKVGTLKWFPVKNGCRKSFLIRTPVLLLNQFYQDNL
jgi:hypothetical protein